MRPGLDWPPIGAMQDNERMHDMGHIMDREDALGRELGLCNDPEHERLSKGCTVAMSDDLADKLAEVRPLLRAVSDLASDAAMAWDEWVDYSEHGDAHERAKLERVRRRADAMLRAFHDLT